MFRQPESKRTANRNNNPAWRCGSALSVVIVTSEEIHVGSIGDSRVVAYNLQGQGRFAIFHKDLTRDHRSSGRAIQAEERARVNNTGFTLDKDRIKTKIMKDE